MLEQVLWHSRTKKISLHRYLIALRGWLELWDLSILVSELIKGLGIQTNNAFAPSAQCTDFANKNDRPSHKGAPSKIFVVDWCLHT